MKSGLEGRNNRHTGVSQQFWPIFVSMKSGLEGRNNSNGSSWTLVFTT